MQTTRTRTETINIMNGLMTIDKVKLEQTAACVTYFLMYIVRGILITGCVLFLMISILSGGDGRTSDGNIALMLIFAGYSILCGFSAKLVRMLMEAFTASCRKRNNKRRYSK